MIYRCIVALILMSADAAEHLSIQVCLRSACAYPVGIAVKMNSVKAMCWKNFFSIIPIVAIGHIAFLIFSKIFIFISCNMLSDFD